MVLLFILFKLMETIPSLVHIANNTGVCVILSLPFLHSETRKYIFYLGLIIIHRKNINMLCSCYHEVDKDECFYQIIFTFCQLCCCCQAEMNIILSFFFYFGLTKSCPKMKPRPRADKYFIWKRKINIHHTDVCFCWKCQ